jgi:uncharacterized damage-inducible protein DinB
MTWTLPTPDPADGPTTGDERPMLEAFLNYKRVTLLNICAGLTAQQLAARPLPASDLSLLGLIRHMAKVERIWFRQRAGGQPVGPMYDPARGKDADFNDGAPEQAETDCQRLRDEWALCDDAVRDLSLDVTFDAGGGATYSLRMMYLHMIDEYARHNGHADLLREQIDGATGR